MEIVAAIILGLLLLAGIAFLLTFKAVENFIIGVAVLAGILLISFIIGSVILYFIFGINTVCWTCKF